MPDLDLLSTPRSGSDGRVWEAAQLDGYGGSVLLTLTEGAGDWHFRVVVKDKHGADFTHGRGICSQKHYALRAALAVAAELVHPGVIDRA
jgi:hypothetical protein